jgi:trk system potassium uptake protein TrkH
MWLSLYKNYMIVRSRKFFPGRVAIVSFILVLMFATLILSLPGIHLHKQLSLTESFFMATSSLAVTGLEVVPFQEFSFLGQTFLMLLIQIGGLGIATLSLIVIALFVDMGLSVQSIASELLELEHVRNIKRILLFIAGLTICCELLAVIPLMVSLSEYYDFWYAFRLSFFHAISSFCNAGIHIFPHTASHFSHDLLFLSTSAALMLIGGIGFFVWYNFLEMFQAWRRDGATVRLSLHTRIVLTMTFWLVFVASLLFYVLEYQGALATMSPFYKVVNALFNGISMRSVGFLTVSIKALSYPTLLLIMVISFIGSAPGSTGSGIRVTSFALLLATIRAVLHGVTTVNVLHREIYREQLMKAYAIIFLSISLVIVLFACLLMCDAHLGFFELAFESVAAFANTGLSTGITPALSQISKILLAAAMFIGRAGILTVIFAFRMRDRRSDLLYPEEHILLT